jgi:hypothetical protein
MGPHSTIYGAEQGIKERVMKPIYLVVTETGELVRDVSSEIATLPMRNTLLEQMYPEITVASIQVPSDAVFSSVSRAQIEAALGRIVVDGVPLKLIGGSGSAKDGKFYAVDLKHWPVIAKRFQDWPEALMSYLGILLSECHYGIIQEQCRVLVVPDNELGTNDCRGWVSRQLFQKFVHLNQGGKWAIDLEWGRFYQFRMVFGSSNAKGSFKVMESDVASALRAEVVLPESSLKPATASKQFQGDVLIGIRDVSKHRRFNGSYILTAHAPVESIIHEILPMAKAQIEAVRHSVSNGDYWELLDLIGVCDDQEEMEPDQPNDAPGYTSVETQILNSILKADGSGQLVRFPAIQDRLQSLAARWAFRMCTAGGLTFPGFALADDGVLFLHNDKVCSASDWLPEEYAISDLPANGHGLVVRYPIRMVEDLLPFTTLPLERASSYLALRIGEEVPTAKLVDILLSQVRLTGTLVLNSQTAKLNGGDFDFDMICVVEGDKYPCWVGSRFNNPGRPAQTKNKAKKKNSPLWNLPQVALGCLGNQIGQITNLMTSAVSRGDQDSAYQLAEELQKALDRIKHGTEPDTEKLREMDAKVPLAPWIGLKRIKRISDLPLSFEVPECDRVGKIYNTLRSGIEEIFPQPLELHDFRGMFIGNELTQAMLEECRLVNQWFGTEVSKLFAEEGYLRQAKDTARTEYLLAKGSGDKQVKTEVWLKYQSAKARLAAFDDSLKTRWKSIFVCLAKWAEQKADNRPGWLQALSSVVCYQQRQDQEKKGRGSILLHTFQQEFVDAVCQQTGGRPVVVSLPELPDGELVIDNERACYSVNGHTFILFELTTEGDIILDGRRVKVVRPFDASGAAQVKNGKVFFAARQHPKVEVRSYVN